jgi:rhodanese-related sulfurtransferase
LRIQRQTINQALLLVAAAIIIGFAYSYVTKQGFFSRNKQADAAVPPMLEMIPLEKAKELYKSQNALFIDSRHAFEYKMGHIHNATNIPLMEIDTNHIRLKDIPKEKMLIVYCNGDDCNSSIELALKLMELKFTNVKVFFGGWQEWKESNLPIDKN